MFGKGIKEIKEVVHQAGRELEQYGKKTILFIDGRNFLDKIRTAVGNKNINFSIYNFKGLIDKVLSEMKIDEKIFYFGKF